MKDRPQPAEPERMLHTHPVKFIYQKSERYQPLTERGLARDLESSEFCWLASIDMAVSTQLPDDAKRLVLVTQIATTLYDLGLLVENGRAEILNRESQFVDTVNTQLANNGILLELEPLDITHPNDLVNELREGNMLLLTTYNEGGYGHMVLMDKLFSDKDHTEVIMSYWNPIVPRVDLPFAREFVGTGRFSQQGRSAMVSPNGYIIRHKTERMVDA